MSVAWLLRLSLAGLLIFALSWWLVWQALGRPLLGILGGLIILFGHALVLAGAAGLGGGFVRDARSGR